MSIKEIHQFTEWVQQGDASLRQRYDMFLERRHAVEEQMAELQSTMDMINHKCWYYEKALAWIVFNYWEAFMSPLYKKLEKKNTHLQWKKLQIQRLQVESFSSL